PVPQQGFFMVSESGTVSPEWRKFQRSMQKMHAAMMSAEPSNNGDVDFVRLMLPHHQAAIEMESFKTLAGGDSSTLASPRRFLIVTQLKDQSQVVLRQSGASSGP